MTSPPVFDLFKNVGCSIAPVLGTDDDKNGEIDDFCAAAFFGAVMDSEELVVSAASGLSSRL